MMRTSENGLQLIKGSEDVRLRTYVCPAGILTVGWGHTGIDVRTGMVITLRRADEMLASDVRNSETAINQLVDVPLTQNQFDALASFVFNVGVGNFESSTLLRKLNAKNYAGAALEFPRWNKSKGKVLAGLTTRRDKERALFEQT